MIDVDWRALPREINVREARALAGESAYWYCTSCKQWKTSTIPADGAIVCPVCGNSPDDDHPPLLAYRSRLDRINALCAKGSEWRSSYDLLMERYRDFIDEVWDGLPARSVQSGYQYFSNEWRKIDRMADYLLTAPDAPATDCPHVYTESGLQRKYYRSDRKYNITNLSDLVLPFMADERGVQYTAQEAAEITSFKAGFSVPFFDTYFDDDILAPIKDGIERDIAIDLSMGLRKRDIERKYALTESQVRTKIRHIARAIKNRGYLENRL